MKAEIVRGMPEISKPLFFHQREPRVTRPHTGRRPLARFMRKSHDGVSPAAPVHATQSRELVIDRPPAREPVIYPNWIFSLCTLK
jgi:hypothetical protein